MTVTVSLTEFCSRLSYWLDRVADEQIELHITRPDDAPSVVVCLPSVIRVGEKLDRHPILRYLT
jgi:hypothetical protein